MKYDQNKYYYEGYAAQTNNCAYEECELKLGTPSRLDWCQGWRDAEYDSSLSTSQQPAWSGEGLPQVGVECECKVTVNWFRCKVMYISEKCAVLKYGESEQAWFTSSCEFRPIRTEAERRREAFIESLMTEWLFLGHDGEQAGALYDAIAAGKIPGVKLEAADE